MRVAWQRINRFVSAIWIKINSRLLYKMIIIYSLLTVIPLILVSTTFYLKSKSAIETKLIESRTQSLVETSDKIDGILRVLSDRINDIGESRNVIDLLHNDFDPIQYPLEANERKSIESTVLAILNYELFSSETARTFVDAIYIVDPGESSKMVYSSEGSKPIEYLAALKVMPYQNDHRPKWAFFIDQNRMICSKKIVDKSTGKTIGFAALMLKPDQVASQYSSYPKNTFFMINRNGIILSSDNPEQIGTFMETNRSSDTFVIKRFSNNPEIVYLNLVSKATLYKEINDLGYFAGATTLITLIIVLLLTIAILRRVTLPLRKLSVLMRKAEKEVFEPITGIKTYDEIAQLGKSFNSLISEITGLIEKVYKAELYKKEAEIKAIRMHMNPHFLYNTLETIGILAKSKEKMTAVPDVVQKLSRILRFSIAPGNDFIPLQIEIQFAEWYIEIHQYRYHDRLSKIIHVPDELMQIRVPKLILQPIIENAFIHGISQTERPGLIVIRAFEEEYDLVLEVEDNGSGFQTKGGKQNSDSQSLGTGLEQVKTRIQLLYGQRYGIIVARSDSNGTLVRFKLPVMMNEERGDEVYKKSI